MHSDVAKEVLRHEIPSQTVPLPALCDIGFDIVCKNMTMWKPVKYFIIR